MAWTSSARWKSGWFKWWGACARSVEPQRPRALREAGGRGMIMLSGYRWTLEKKEGGGTVYTSDERFDREVKPWAVCLPGGAPLIRHAVKEGDFHGARWAMMCRATDYAKKTIVDVARYCVQAGWPVIHFDQEVSGNYAASVCYSDQHGHPVGHGKWAHEAMADLYKRIRETCAPLDPDFALSMEEPNELYLQQLNLCQERPFGITTEWPCRKPETRSAPLFMYLYHDYLVGWAAFYPWKAGGHSAEVVAKGFTAGQMPGLTPIGPADAEQDPALAEMMENCMKAYRTYALDYLLFGRMLEPPPIDAPDRKLQLGNQGETTVPAVWHSAWRAPDGRIGVALANSLEKEQGLKLDLTPLLPAGASAKVVYKTLADETPLAGLTVEVKVPARSLALVEMTIAGL
ncbi:MAG: DUF6259 domain-containing protein [Candidatus Sumerlaeota bacterium]|nr:DUF6259 domain-containing protein [Candidatus Sumerlaeota bacterium]